MKNKMYLLVLVLALAAATLSACGGSSSASDFPSGKFIKEGTEDYGLILNGDGTFTVYNGIYTLVDATYKVDGSVFTETSNNGGCDTNLSFNYTFDGKNLTFTYVGNPEEDACEGRRTDFNNVTYVLSK